VTLVCKLILPANHDGSKGHYLCYCSTHFECIFRYPWGYNHRTFVLRGLPIGVQCGLGRLLCGCGGSCRLKLLIVFLLPNNSLKVFRNKVRAFFLSSTGATAGAAAPAGVLLCNTQQGICMAVCASTFLLPTP